MKLSIVTPNYNYSQYIGKLLDSVLAQDYDDFEHIIVDDGSNDNSIEIINNYVDRHPDKFKLIIQENRGQTAAIIVGLKMASGDIIGWINSDDTYCENTFTKVIAMFKENPRIDIVFGDINVMDLAGNFIYRRRHLNFSYISGSFLGFANILSSNAVFWQKHVMLKTNLPNEAFKCNMDGEYYSRLTIDMKVIKINAALANFRKQFVTKAAENHSNWDRLVQEELHYELLNSYNRLIISRYLPFKFSYVIKLLLRIRRIFFRLLKLHFIDKYFEIRLYNLKRNP